MRSTSLAIMASIIFLSFVAVAFAQTNQEYISSIEIYVDGRINGASGQNLKSILEKEDGVDKVTINIKKGTIVVTPVMSSMELSLYDLWNKANDTKEYIVRKMDIVAQGHLLKVSTKVYEDNKEILSRDKYELQTSQAGFALFQNSKLDDLIKSGDTLVRVIGNVSSFFNQMPILVIGEFEKAGKPEESKLIEKVQLHTYAEPMGTITGSMQEETEMMKNEPQAHIDIVKVYVDLEPNAKKLSELSPKSDLMMDLLEESGVAAVSVDPKAEAIKIMPKPGEIFLIYNIWHRIETQPGYNIVKMDVVASGNLSKINLEKTVSPWDVKLQERYELIIGRYTGLVLADNDELQKMVKSKGEAFTIRGTITSFRDELPVVDVKDFKSIKGELEWL